ncbi:MAG: hypothetical protein CFE21_00760 [Bacteroidetes bacterium B1(2017)]|nr:MAG: hypothetical protein CFE21_00760 [Bacteroidetes bacterium B1(2017)]
MSSIQKHIFKSSSLLITLFLLLFSTSTNASYIVGSDIRYTCSGTPGVYTVEVKLYRDCQGLQLCASCPASISPTCSIQLNITGGYTPTGSGLPTSPCAGSSFGSTTLSVVGSASGFDVIQLCNTEKTICTNCGTRTAGTFTPGVEVYTFTGQVNLNALPASCCLVSLSFTTCCRNPAITSFPTPAAQNYCNEVIINRCATPCNSAPIFTNAPVIIACAGQDFFYNLGAIDPDGDSLSYNFGAALSGPNTPIPYTSPYSPSVPFPYLGAPVSSPPAIPPTGISIDPVRGDIRVRPMGVFTAMLTIEVKQWKTIGGIPTLMGITRRDIQFGTQICAINNWPVLKTYSEVGTLSSPQPNYSYYVCAGQQLCFMLSAWDNTASTDSTDITWNAPANLVATGATFTKCYNPATRGTLGPKFDSVRFCWTPPDSMASNLPYYFVVKATDRACPLPANIVMSFSVLVRKIPVATIIKTIKSCGNYDFSYTLQNGVPLNLSNTLFKVETLPNSGIYQTYNANAVSNHHFANAGWYKIKLQVSTAPPPSPGGCTNNNILDSVLVQQPVSVSIRDTFTCFNTPVLVTAKGSYGAQFGANGYMYTFYSGDSNSTTVIKPISSDSTCLINYGTPFGTSNYKVLITDQNGCKDSAVFKVFTKQNLSVSLSTFGSTFLCMGDSVKLQSSISSSNGYTWYNNNVPIPNQIANFLIVKNTGSYRVAIADSSGCVAASSPVSITVNSLPIANLSPTDSALICVGSSQLLTANSGYGLSYDWYLNDTLISGQNVRTLAATEPGMYTVKTSNLSGCSTFSSPFKLVLKPNPIASITPTDSASICVGSNILLTANSDSNLSYQWYRNNTLLSGQTLPTLTATAAGMYKVRTTSLTGCSTFSSPLQLVVNTYPVASINPSNIASICVGSNQALTANSGANLSYEWYLNDTLISGQALRILTATKAGIYKVKTSNLSGCSSFSSPFQLVVNPNPIASITPADSASICVGSSQVLTANSGSNLSYEWYFNTTQLSGQNLRTFAASSAGMYKVKTMNLYGCSTFSSPVQLRVHSNPVAGSLYGPITGLSTATSYTYSIASQVGISYNWLISNGSITSGQGTNSVTVQWTSPGTCILLVAITNASNCTDTASILTSIGSPTPSILYFSPDSARTNEVITINGGNLTGASSVKLGGVNVVSYTVVSSHQINAVVGAGASGMVEVETPLGTAQKAGFTYISSTGLGSSMGAPKLSIYPNPVHNELVICCIEPGAFPTNLSITDMLGRVVAEPSKILNGNSIEISTQNLAPGTYIICIQKGNDLSRMKFVKE